MSPNETLLSEWWLHSAIGGGLLLLLAGLLMAVTRQPARRQRLGEWGVLAALAVALLSVAPAWLLVPLPQTNPPAPVVAAEERPAPAPANLTAPQAPAWTPDATTTAQTSPPESPTHNSAETPPAIVASPWTLTTLCHWPVLAYLVVVAFLLVRWLWQYLRLWRLLRSARPAREGAAQLFGEMASGVTPAPRLLVSARLHIPISCGLLRPTVLLPAALAHQTDETALRWVFAHELTHLRRRDAWNRAAACSASG